MDGPPHPAPVFLTRACTKLEVEAINHQHHPWRALPRAANLAKAHEQLHKLAYSNWPQTLGDARACLLDTYNLPIQDVRPDLFIKNFNNLDAVFFAGVLRDPRPDPVGNAGPPVPLHA